MAGSGCFENNYTSTVVIKHLQKIFASQGIPERVISDNGPQFVSQEFESFLKDHGIAHRKITPYWPQANAQVERFNRTIEKSIRGANVAGKDWRKELYTFLLNYRATPHASTGISPALLHLGREIRTKVPQVDVTISATVAVALHKAQASDMEAKQKMARYNDTKKRAKTSTLQVGDKVLLQQIKQHKLSTRYDCRPYTIIERSGSSVILQRRDNPPIMRNVSMVHKIPNDITEDDDDDTSEMEEETSENIPEESDSESEVSEADVPASPGDVRPPDRPARQVRPPLYLRDFVP